MRLFRDDLEDAAVCRGQPVRARGHPASPDAAFRVGRAGCSFEEGARGDEFMVLLEGNATVSQQGQTIATLERGDLVGEMALLEADGARRRNATVTANTDAVVYVGSRSEFRQILQAAPSVARKVRQTAAARTEARAA